MVSNLRTYGKAPFTLAVIHGGPGAPGQMAPVARTLSATTGVLEPLQTAISIKEQVKELKLKLEQNAISPIVYVGSSWGAMLSFIFTAHHPAFIKRLILVGSGVYEEKYVHQIFETRINRFSEKERLEIYSLLDDLNDPSIPDKNALMAKLGKLFTKIDAYNPYTLDTEELEVQYNVYRNVWNEAQELRASGKLLKLGKQISCPVIVIHGDYDPHPVEGIQKPLSTVLKDLKVYILKNCGHLPWIETEAKENFYATLKREMDL